MPAEFAAHFFSAGDQHGGIAGVAWEHFVGDFAAGDAAEGSHHFADGVTGTGANIERGAGEAVDLLEDANMGGSDVQDVNVIPDASSIGSGVVVAENKLRDSSVDGVERPRNQMGFMAARFSAVAGGAGNIEVAEADVAKSGIFSGSRRELLQRRAWTCHKD